MDNEPNVRCIFYMFTNSKQKFSQNLNSVVHGLSSSDG